MTDRHSSYVVVLEKDIREDDAEAIITALKMVKGVLKVTPQVASGGDAVVGMYRERERVMKVINDAYDEIIRPKAEGSK